MKVLFLTNQLDVGGIETNLVRLTRELTKRGHSVVAATAGGTLVGAFEAAGGRHEVVPASLRAARTSLPALRRLVAMERPDIVHVFSASTAVLARAALAGHFRSRPPVVASIMGLKTDPGEPAWKTWLRAYFTSLGARRLLVMSPAIDRVVRTLPVRRRRTTRMSAVGVEVPDRPPHARASVRAELGLSGDALLVTTIGRLDPTKSHELFVDAAAQVLRRRPEVVFLVVGGGPLREELERRVATAGCGDQVRLIGERSDVTRLLSATDVYVRPGIVEGFIGITVLEAQVLGVPAVAFETEDVKLAIEDGVTGVLVPAGDAAALATAVAELLDAPERATALARAGRARAVSTYGLQVVVDGLEKLYTRLLDSVELTQAARGTPRGS